MRATVEDVHHGDGQQVHRRAADVLVQRELGRLGGGAGHGKRNTQDGVGAKLGLVGGAVQSDHHVVQATLIGGIPANDLLVDDLVDVINGLLNALAAVISLVTIAQFGCLEGAGGRTRRDCGDGERAVVQQGLYLNGGVATRIKNLAGLDVFDKCHGCLPFRSQIGFFGPVLSVSAASRI